MHPWIGVVGVVESGNRSRRRAAESLLARILRRHPKVRVDLIIPSNRRLITERLERRRQELEVIGGAGRLRDVRHRPELQNIDARLIQPVLRNPAQHSAVLEAAARVRRRAGGRRPRVANQIEHVAVVVARLRKIALSLEGCRHAELPQDVGRRARAVLLRIEEEELVVPAGPSHRAAEGVAVVRVLGHLLRGAVDLVDPAVRVPVRIAHDAVERPVELIGSALGDCRDLQSARTAVFRLVAGREHLDLGDRLRVHLQQLPVVARVHRGHAVHHDVVLSAAAEARRRAGDTGRERRESGEVAARADRQVLDFRRRDAERTFAALRLDEGRIAGDGDGLAGPADRNREVADPDAVTAAQRDAVAAQALEAVHRDFDGVGVGAGVGEHEVAAAACDRGRRSRAAALADEHDCGTRHREPLFILHRSGDGAGRDLRQSRVRR